MGIHILVLCDFSENSAGTIIDHALSFKKYSKNSIYYYNPVYRKIPDWLHLDSFDVIVVHYTLCSIYNDYLDYSWRKSISASSALKVQFIQDEYRNVNYFHKFLSECNINVLFTCFPSSEVEKVYPTEKLPRLKKFNTLTGYVPEYLEEKEPDYNAQRSIDVGYRARGEGAWWLGELYQEKLWIGQEFKKRVEGKGLTCDISNREEDRIYGADWLKFLSNCRCTLGTESGASVIDFTNEIENSVKQYCLAHPNASFHEVQTKFLLPHEGKIKMNQISPRVFEAIGCGTALILFEGEYSGVVTPDVHYISLKKDFSNLEEVLRKITDTLFISTMTRRAYNDVIGSGRYSYRAFVHEFDDIIAKCILDKDSDVIALGSVSKTNMQEKAESILKKIMYTIKRIYPLKRFIIRLYYLITGYQKSNFLKREKKRLKEFIRRGIQ